ncbi:MAG: drug/metabolite exporter YedA [Polyangiaceae bacterium]
MQNGSQVIATPLPLPSALSTQSTPRTPVAPPQSTHGSTHWTPLTFVALAAVYVIWSSTYLALKIAIDGLPTLLMGGTRYFCAGAILLAVLKLRGAPWPTAREWLYSTPVGALMFLVGNGFVAIAEHTIATGVAAVTCAAMPLFAAAIASFVGERPKAREWVGLAIGFAGVVVLFLGADLRAEPLGAALLVMAPIGWAIGSMLTRRLPLPSGLMAASTQMVTGGLLTIAAGLIRGEQLPAHPPVRALLAMGYLIVFGSLVAFSAYTYLLRNTRPSVAMSYAYVNPALAVLLGAWWQGEHVGGETLGATLLIVLGVASLVTQKKG